MNYTVNMGLGAMIYIPTFLKIGGDIQKLIGENTYRHTDTHCQEGYFISFYFFFQNQEIRLKINLKTLTDWVMQSQDSVLKWQRE
jgi:hypothetical protein